MSAFLTRLRVEILPPSEVTGTNLYRLTEPFVIDSNIVGRFEVPAGFVTNFASVPWIAYRYIHPEKPCICYPSAAHDYGYAIGGLLPDGRFFDRPVWDDVLEELMVIAGARWDERKVVRRAVGMFGGSHWVPAKKAA
jgi:hypothetical protein